MISSVSQTPHTKKCVGFFSGLFKLIPTVSSDKKQPDE